MRFLKLLLLFIFCTSVSFAQLTFTNNPAATTLANSIVGFGITVTNASLTCPNGASAVFGNGNTTTLGLTNGILLTTGTASSVANSASNGFLGLSPLSVSNGTGGDALMDGLTGQGANSSFDRCKLEFDINAQCSNLLIKYKFASEEYPDFVGAGVNDAFGFFLTGPNPSGGNYTNQNLALVPGLGIPVNIENINDATNSGFYVDNSGSGNIEYDGITTLLTASANITPCSNYHLILEIADGGDDAYDSGVFLQFGGLSCPTPTITANAVASSCTANTGSASVTVTGVAASSYSWLPGGQTTSSITNQAPGTYTCSVTFTNGVCAPIVQTKTVIITSPGVIPTVAVNSNTPCVGSTLSLTATSNGNTYSWSGPNSFSSTLQNPTISSVDNLSVGQYTLVVTNTVTGCVKTSYLTTTVSLSPTISATTGSLCGGSSATLTASGATNYTWSPTTGLSTTSGSVVVANPTVTTIYNVVGSLGGCTGNTSTTVSIVGNPIVTVANASVCAGSSTNLTANGAANYTWSPSADLSAGTGSLVSANPTVTTTYTILGANGTCTNTTTATVSVTANPTVSAISASVCSGNSVSISASGATSYIWNPSSTLSASTGSLVSANPTVTTIYTVIGANGSCTNSATSTVSVTTTPTVSATSGSICSGSSINLTANGAANYTWSPSTDLSVSTGSTVNANPTVTTIYTIIGANGTCTNSTTGTVSVTANPTVSLTGSDICSGASSATLTASGANTYSWSPSLSLSSSTGSLVTANPAVTTDYTVTGTINACVNTSVITVSVLPTPTITATSATMCAGSSANISASGALTYTWSSASSLSSSTGSVVIATPSITTTYSVVGSSGTCTNSAVTTVTVVAIPAIMLTSNDICSGGTTATLTANGAANYTWSPSGSLSSNSGSVVIANPTITTTYSVTGELSSCTNTAVTIVNVVQTPTLSVTDGTICSGTSGSLTVSGAVNYTWSPATNLSANTGSVVNANPNTTEIYTIIGAIGTCTSSVTNTMNVITTPTISVSSASICSGNTVTLTANGAPNYTWSPSATLSATSGSVVAANPVTTTTYVVMGANFTCTHSVAVVVDVTTTPTVSVNNMDICSGLSSATLTANGATNYIWTPTADLSISTGSVVIATPSITTDYTVTGANGVCTNTAVSTVSVLVTPTVTTIGNTICSGTSGTLSASGAMNYTWSPSSSLSVNSGSIVIANPVITTTYNILGAIGTCTNSAVVIMKVNVTPTVTATSGTICSGRSVNLIANGAANYTWTPSATLNNSNTGSVSANPTITTTYTITGETATCSNSVVTTVSVTQTPTVSVTNGTICSGSSVNLTASGAANYVWIPNTALSNSIVAVVTASPNITTTYTVFGANGTCTASAVSNVSVTITPTVSVNSGTLCSGSTITLTANGAINYTWSPGVTSLNSSSSSVSDNPTATTIYTVVGANGNCTDAKTATLTVLPDVVVRASPSVEICYGQSTIMYANGGAIYNWSPSTGLLHPNDSITFANPLVNTVYTVSVTKPGYCTKTSTVEIIVRPLPIIDAGKDTTINIDESVTLFGTGDVDVGFLKPESYDLQCNFCSSINVNPQDNTCFVLTGKNSYGCRSFDTVCVFVTKEWEIYIPNSFTPNDDLLNDTFAPYGYGIKEIHMVIFNRWGQQVYKEDGLTVAWDGKYKGVLSEQDVYVYQIDVVSLGGKKERKIGHIMLLSKTK